jgi:hypothetical protein
MSLFCRLGLHDNALVYATRATADTPAVPARWRCARCGREKPVGMDNTDRKTEVRYAGHLTVSEVKRITRRTKRSPVYVSPQVLAELEAAAAVARTRKQRKDGRKGGSE